MSEKLSDFDYPKWKYHAVQRPRIVNSRDEELDLGPGWENSPAYFEKKSEAKDVKNIKEKVKDLWQRLAT